MFEWQIDRNGYDLDLGRGYVVRRGGEMGAYEPDQCAPAPHYLFANLRSQIDEAGASRPSALLRRRNRVMRGNPFWARRFESEEAALLSFIRDYGFLGSSGRGPDTGSEPLEYLIQQQRRLSTFYDFAMGGTVTFAIENFNRYVVPDMTVRLEVGEGGAKRLRVLPRSLIAWMWFRVGEEISSGVTWVRCDWCDKPMARGGGKLRADARFCSASCRTMANRQQTAGKGQRP